MSLPPHNKEQDTQMVQQWPHHYLFITDIHHNYVLLRKEFKGLNFIRWDDIPPRPLNKDKDKEETPLLAPLSLIKPFPSTLSPSPTSQEVMEKRIHSILGDDCRFITYDNQFIDIYKFTRIVIMSANPSDLSSTHKWVSIDDCKTMKRELNSMVSRHLHRLKMHSRFHSAGTLVFDSTNKDNILLVRGKLSNKFGVPKGHLKPCETFHDAAIRETMEETGLQVKDLSQVPYTIDLKKTKLFKVTIDPKDTDQLVPLDTDEVAEVRWVNKKMLRSFNMTKLTQQLLKCH